MARADRHDGLSLGYRMWHRFRVLAFTVLGPAQLDERTDPLARLRREREAKIAQLREARERRGDDR